eukprot:scaffold10196_cov129-Isochrysis_galbana.AAC.1
MAMQQKASTATATTMATIQPTLDSLPLEDRAWPLPSLLKGRIGGGAGGDSTRTRLPQSAQSDAYAHVASAEPAAPSLHTPSSAKKQVLAQE